MSTTSTSGTGAPGDDFGIGRLFLADSRMAWVLANHARYAVMRQVFGVSREQANLLSLVLALGAAETAYATARRVRHPRLRVHDTDVGIAAFALREAALSVAGPSARGVPGFAPLLALGVAGGLALPGLRYARRLRATEQRVRARRQSRYSAAAAS
jgi:hypothetical protein